MSSRQEVPGLLAVSGQVVNVAENTRRSVYIASVSQYSEDCQAAQIGPMFFPAGIKHVQNIIPPIQAPTGFTVPHGYQVIYYFD